MNINTLELIAMYSARILIVLIVLTVHEFFHAFAAVKNGDLTAKFYGRYSLNPIRHFDPLGLIMCVFAGFGWAKPVPINPNNFNHYKKGLVWTSLAGVLSNYAMAFVGYPLTLLFTRFVPVPTVADNALIILLYLLGFFLVQFFYLFNLSIFVFNLIPLYPLDGFRLWDALDRKRGRVFQFVRRYGNYILMGLILLHFGAEYFSFLRYIDVLGYLLAFAQFVFAKPITLLWDFIFGLIYG